MANDYNVPLEFVDGNANFNMTVVHSSATGRTQLHITCLDADEIRVLKKRFYVIDSTGKKYLFDDKTNTLDLSQLGNVQFYFDKQPVGQIQGGILVQPKNTLTLSATRAIGDLDDSLTTVSAESNTIKDIYSRANNHDPNHEHTATCNHEHDGKRIDAHTHFVAAFPMKAALEKAMEIHQSANKQVAIPTLVILKILKDKGLINDANHAEWVKFFNDNRHDPPSNKETQKDNSKDLIKEDFATFIKKLEQEGQTEELKACVKQRDPPIANYIDLNALKQKLDAESPQHWEQFCKGFDLSGSHACDFTDHMESAYGLRNWFGKDDNFMRAQIEVIYAEYENNGINYAELPGGPFKNPATLEKFIEITRDIEAKRAAEGKMPITLRPGLSIARLIDPATFRANLFSYAELILKYPEIASVSLLAHETNPTTEHLLAIRDFVALINEHRPGFTVELHAGEMATHGATNMREARSFARNNPLTLVRGGHTIYGNHKAEALDNFIEEKCPLSNDTLIRVEPEAQVNALLAIVEGRSKIFWGSDGILYNPEYGPDKQKEYYIERFSHPTVQAELQRRYNDPNYTMDRFETNTFEAYKAKFMSNLVVRLAENEENEDSYIHFKKCEMDFCELKLNRAMLVNLYGNNPPEEISSLLKQMDQLINNINDRVKDNALTPYTEIRKQLINHHGAITELNTQLNNLCKMGKLKNITPEQLPITPEQLPKIRREQAYKQIEPDILKQRAAVDLYNKLYKLNKKYEGNLNAELKNIFMTLQQQLEQQDTTLALSEMKLSTFVEAAGKIPEQTKKLIDEEITKAKLGNSPGDARCESFLDPNYEMNLKIKQMNEANQASLEKYSSNKTHVPQDTVVLFGGPETMLTPAAQKAYMEDLYKNIYKILKDAVDNGQQVMLLGGISEGINPLVYKVLNDHPHLFEKCIPTHVIANDESFSAALTVGNHKDILDKRANTSPNGMTVPYFVADKKREEAHIAYADFVSQYGGKDNAKMKKVIQLGGEQALWYDTNVVLNDRFRNTSQEISYYQYTATAQTRSAHAEPGEPASTLDSPDNQVPGIKGSTRFAQGNPNQAFNYASQVAITCKDDLLEEKYDDKSSKATSYDRNLIFTYYALKTSLQDAYKLKFDLPFDTFIKAHSPQYLPDGKMVPLNEATLVKDFFQNLMKDIDKRDNRIEILKSILKILHPEKGIGVGKVMAKYNNQYNLLKEVEGRLAASQPGLQRNLSSEQTSAVQPDLQRSPSTEQTAEEKNKQKLLRLVKSYHDRGKLQVSSKGKYRTDDNNLDEVVKRLNEQITNKEITTEEKLTEELTALIKKQVKTTDATLVAGKGEMTLSELESKQKQLADQEAAQETQQSRKIGF